MSKSYLGKLGEAPIVMLVGPVAYWWDTEDYQHWNTPEHWHYVAWRERVNDALVENGYLVYRHWEAWKGTWNNKAQALNNVALDVSDIVVNLRPDYAWSEGTDEEIERAAKTGKKVLNFPPPSDEETFSWSIQYLLVTLAVELGL